MNKIFLIVLIALGVSTVSCTATKNAEVAQANKADFQNLKGTWEITQVDYDKSYKIKAFDEAGDAKCFIGSIWKLIPNNYTGSYTLQSSSPDCPQLTQPIKFEVVDGSVFQFKKLEQGLKAKAIATGYKLNYVKQSADQFLLVQNVPFDGNVIKVTYQFQKQSTK